MTSASVLSLAARNAVLARGSVLARCGALTMIGLGLFLRVHAFGFPTSFLEDEGLLVESAQSYLARAHDFSTDPPLGKLIIAASIGRLGDNPLGWRAPALLFGMLTVIAGAAAATRLFRSRDAGLFTAGLLCADGFLIAYSRTALLDGYLTACAVAALWIATLRVTLVSALLGGVLAGIACNILGSGVAVFVPLLLAIAISTNSARTRLSLAFALLGSGALVYVGLYAYGLGLSHDSVTLSYVLEHARLSFEGHVAIEAVNHDPWTSTGQLLPRRAPVLGAELIDGSVYALSPAANLLTWWSSIALALAVFSAIAMRGLRATLSSDSLVLAPVESLRPSTFVATHGRAVVLVLSAALGFLAPWTMANLESYLYFLPAYAGLIVLLGGYTAQALRHHPLGTFVFTLLILTVAVFYAPLWSFMPLSQHDIDLRLFLPSWR